MNQILPSHRVNKRIKERVISIAKRLRAETIISRANVNTAEPLKLSLSRAEPSLSSPAAANRARFLLYTYTEGKAENTIRARSRFEFQRLSSPPSCFFPINLVPALISAASRCAHWVNADAKSSQLAGDVVYKIYAHVLDADIVYKVAK